MRLSFGWVLALVVGVVGCRPASDEDGLIEPVPDERLRAPDDGKLDNPEQPAVKAEPQLPLEEYRESRPPRRSGYAPRVRFIALSKADTGEDWDCNPQGVRKIQRVGGSFDLRHLAQRTEEMDEGAGEEAIFVLRDPPKAYRRYCVLEWQAEQEDAAPSRRDMSAARNFLQRNFAEYSEDLQVPAPQASEMDELVWGPLAVAWRAQLDELRPLPNPAPGTEVTTIRVAVADTSPRSDTGDARQGLSDHGLAMGRMAKVLGCPLVAMAGGPCIAHVAHHLALPRAGANVRPAQGGFYGFQGEAAVAIMEAVRRWIEVGRDDGQPHLVINLSLGWDGRYGGSLVRGRAGLRPPVRAVFDAITYASCHGALVIAAAGNRSGGPDERPGPLYPAGWERAPAPSAAVCAALGVPQVDDRGVYRPLLYSAGGVRGDDRLLANARPGGVPRLVAPAFQAAIGDEEAGMVVTTGVHTGSSVAAAAVSAIAATVWGYRPDLGRHEVMDTLYDSAVDLHPSLDGDDVRPDYCLRDACSAMSRRRVSMCQALNAACAAGGGACPAAPPACATTDPYMGRIDAIQIKAEEMLDYATRAGLMVDAEVDASVMTGEVGPGPICDYGPTAVVRRHIDHDGETLAASCPSKQFYQRNAMPWASPQPWINVCPTCFFDATADSVAIYTSSEYSGQVFTDGLLSFTTKEGKVLESMALKDLGLDVVNGGESYIVQNVSPSVSYEHVTLEFLTEVYDSKTGKSEITATFDELAWW